MPRVLVFGTFDTLHPGHLNVLREAARYGDVTVSLTPDELCRQYKGHASCHPFATRRQRLLRLKTVHDVIASDTTPGQYRVLKMLRPNVIVLGYDQRQLLPHVKAKMQEFRLPARLVVCRSYRPEVYHSSKLGQMASQA